MVNNMKAGVGYNLDPSRPYSLAAACGISREDWSDWMRTVELSTEDGNRRYMVTWSRVLQLDLILRPEGKPVEKFVSLGDFKSYNDDSTTPRPSRIRPDPSLFYTSSSSPTTTPTTTTTTTTTPPSPPTDPSSPTDRDLRSLATSARKDRPAQQIRDNAAAGAAVLSAVAIGTGNFVYTIKAANGKNVSMVKVKNTVSSDAPVLERASVESYFQIAGFGETAEDRELSAARAMYSYLEENYDDLGRNAGPLLNTEQSVAAMVKCNMTWHQVRAMNQWTAVFGGSRVYSPETAMRALVKENSVAFKTGEAVITLDGTEDLITVAYFTCTDFPALLSRNLQTNVERLRAGGKPFSIHTDLLPLRLSGDHGGRLKFVNKLPAGATKIAVGFDVSEEGGQGVYETSGVYFYKEDAQVQLATIWEEQKKGIEQMNEYEVLVVNGERATTKVSTGECMLVKKTDVAGTEIKRNINNEVVGIICGGEVRDFDSAIKVPSDWHIKVVPIEIFLVADMKFVFMLTGREGGSPHYSAWRRWKGDGKDITNEWLDMMFEESVGDPRKWNRQAAGYRQSIKSRHMLPFNLPIKNILVPVLHIALGLTMGIWTMLLAYVQINVELKSKEFVETSVLRREKEELVRELEGTLSLYLEVHGEDIEAGDDTNKEKMRAIYTEHREQQKAKGKAAPGYISKGVPMARGFTYYTNDPRYSREEKRHFGMKNAVVRMREELKKPKSELDALKKKEITEEEKWKKKTSSGEKLETTLDDVLQENGIEREVYGGHAFTGEMCLILMRNVESIMGSIKEKVKAYMEKRKDEEAKGMTWAPTFQEVEKKLDKFKAAFALFGVVYGAMRTTTNNDAERIAQFPKNVAEFATRFIDLREQAGFKEPRTPKLDALMMEAPKQLARFKSLGRFAEDPIEHLHQTFEKFWRAVLTTRDKEKLMTSLIDKLTTSTMPAVLRLVEEKGKKTKRRFSEEGQERKEEEKRAAKKLRREGERAVEVLYGSRLESEEN